jgi:phospholipid/cholesterol/gamma-HCH transport system substrate-binding protein
MPRTRSIAWSELKLGIVGITAAALTVLVIVAVSGQAGFFWQRYPLKAQFANAQGLKTGALVRLSGKDIGRITSVEFAGANIDVGFEVQKSVRPLITDQTVGTVGSTSLLGESLLDLTAGRGGSPIPDNGYVPTKMGGGFGDLASGFGDLATTASSSLKEAGELIAAIRAGKGTLGKIVTDDALYKELQQFVGSAADLADRLKAGQGTVGRLVNDPAVWNSLRASLENLQATTARLNSGQGALGRFINDEAMGKSLASTLSNLDETTGRLNRGDSTVGKLLTERELYDRLNSMVGRLDAVVAGLNTTEGTAGRLLHDQQLYDNMNHAVVELRDLFADIRKDPKKYLTVRISIF